MAADDNTGSLTLSLRIGESAMVETPDGTVEVRCVKPHGQHGVSIRILAPREFNIERVREQR